MVKTSQWLREGWDMVCHDLGLWLGIGAIITLGSCVSASILAGPLMCGAFYIALRGMRGKELRIDDIAKGFGVFGHALLACIIIGIFAGVASIFFIIPAFFVGALYVFAFPLIINRKMGFWQAMEESRKAVWKAWLGFTWFYFLCGLINLGGAICCIIGVIFTTPIVICAQAAAYRDIIGLAQEEPETTTPQHAE